MVWNEIYDQQRETEAWYELGTVMGSLHSPQLQSFEVYRGEGWEGHVE